MRRSLRLRLRSWVHSDAGQPGSLIEAEHQTGALDHLAGGALTEIVDRRQHEHSAGALVITGGQAYAVGAADPFGRGRFRADMNERLAGISLAERQEWIAWAVRLGITGRKNTARHRHEMRRE